MKNREPSATDIMGKANVGDAMMPENKTQSTAEFKTPKGIKKLQLDISPAKEFGYDKIKIKGEISKDRMLKVLVALGTLKQKDYQVLKKMTGADFIEWGFKEYGVPLK